MEIIGQKVKTKEGKTLTIKKFEKGKIYVSMYDGFEVFIPIEDLIISDELRNEIINKSGNQNGKTKKVLTGVAGVIDVRRAPKEIQNPRTVQSLHKGDCFGTRSADMYYEFCDNENIRFVNAVGGCFGREKRLYAENATAEGYSVWMLAHSTYNGSTAKSGKVVNVIEENSDIVEVYKDASVIPDQVSGEKRVVFVKNACGQYIFWGMTEMAEVRPATKEVVHKYISDTYKAEIKTKD